MYAIAHALDEVSRAEAARLAGMDRQALRDAVVRDALKAAAAAHPGRRLRLWFQDEARIGRNALTATPGRLRSLTNYPWLPCVNA